VAVVGRKQGLVVIPVKPKPEPASFNLKVRQKGSKWIAKQELPLPAGTKIPDYWTDCLDDLCVSYGRICAYVCIYIERVTGNPSVEHFAPKSLHLNLAYEWDNYRLVCGLMNARKSNLEDVLDPFTLKSITFQIDFLNGEMFPNPKLEASKRSSAQKTIDRLMLNDADCCDVRLAYHDDYAAGDISKAQLKRRAPFVYLEMKRQKLL
jgi:hypothetical protein